MIAPEPLTLPEPDMPDRPAAGQPGDLDEACRRILRPVAGFGAGISTDELFRFRWITGHQVSFVIWRLMAQTTEVSAESLANLAGYVRGYCAMLLYTSSCSPEVYQRVIRPSMSARHPGFSGAWAPDYRPVRHFFRGRPSPWTEHPDAGDLLRAVRLYEAVHGGVAAKLVPGGRSLLQEAAGRRGPGPRAQGALYDSYFLTHRAPVSRQDVVAQLVRRLVAVARDVAVHGLHPLPARSVPGELRTAEVLDCERDWAEIAYQVARCAVLGEQRCALG
jgi:hypothetical protein